MGDFCRVNNLLVKNSSNLTGGIGTALYAAPEQITTRDYDPSVLNYFIIKYRRIFIKYF